MHLFQFIKVEGRLEEVRQVGMKGPWEETYRKLERLLAIRKNSGRQVIL